MPALLPGLRTWPATSRPAVGSSTWPPSAAVIGAIKNAGYLHILEGRGDHTAPAETLRRHGFNQDKNGRSPNAPEPCTAPADELPIQDPWITARQDFADPYSALTLFCA